MSPFLFSFLDYIFPLRRHTSYMYTGLGKKGVFFMLALWVSSGLAYIHTIRDIWHVWLIKECRDTSSASRAVHLSPAGYFFPLKLLRAFGTSCTFSNRSPVFVWMGSKKGWSVHICQASGNYRFVCCFWHIVFDPWGIYVQLLCSSGRFSGR